MPAKPVFVNDLLTEVIKLSLFWQEGAEQLLEEPYSNHNLGRLPSHHQGELSLEAVFEILMVQSGPVGLGLVHQLMSLYPPEPGAIDAPSIRLAPGVRAAGKPFAVLVKPLPAWLFINVVPAFCSPNTRPI